MVSLKYKIITSEKQYDKYCKTLEEFVFSGSKSKAIKEEISLLTLLIEKWDEEQNTFQDLNLVGRSIEAPACRGGCYVHSEMTNYYPYFIGCTSV